MKTKNMFCFVFVGLLYLGIGQASAITTAEYLAKVDETRDNSRDGTLNHLSESFELVALLIEWTSMQAGDAIFGQVHLDNPASPLAGGTNFDFYEPGGR